MITPLSFKPYFSLINRLSLKASLRGSSGQRIKYPFPFDTSMPAAGMIKLFLIASIILVLFSDLGIYLSDSRIISSSFSAFSLDTHLP